MSASGRQLAEDKALRDAARRLFQEDLALVRGDLAARGAGGRVADRIGDAALDTVDETLAYAQDHKGQVAAAVSALLLFLFRGPLLDGLSALLDRHDGDDEDEEPA